MSLPSYCAITTRNLLLKSTPFQLAVECEMLQVKLTRPMYENMSITVFFLINHPFFLNVSKEIARDLDFKKLTLNIKLKLNRLDLDKQSNTNTNSPTTNNTCYSEIHTQ